VLVVATVVRNILEALGRVGRSTGAASTLLASSQSAVAPVSCEGRLNILDQLGWGWSTRGGTDTIRKTHDCAAMTPLVKVVIKGAPLTVIR